MTADRLQQPQAQPKIGFGVPAIALIVFHDGAVVISPRQFLRKSLIAGISGMKLLLNFKGGRVFLKRLASHETIGSAGVLDFRAIRLAHPVVAIAQPFRILCVLRVLLRERLKCGDSQVVFSHSLRGLSQQAVHISQLSMAPRRIGAQRGIIRFLFGERSIERRRLHQQFVAKSFQIRGIGELLRLLPACGGEALIHGLFGESQIVFGATLLAPSRSEPAAKSLRAAH